MLALLERDNGRNCGDSTCTFPLLGFCVLVALTDTLLIISSSVATAGESVCTESS